MTEPSEGSDYAQLREQVKTLRQEMEELKASHAKQRKAGGRQWQLFDNRRWA